MKSKIKIGTSGFRTNKIAYAEILSCVEIQQIFYQPPQIKTLEKWRAEMPEDFEFVVKAWQIITHEARSPTYKRLKKQLSETEKAEAGGFKPTAIVREAWETTLACVKALRAKAVLFQCPASFKPYAENLENLRRFFAETKRGKMIFAWEPRGELWTNEIVGEICEEFDLRHVVDPFEKATVTPEKCYYRLHGRGGWRYKYEPDELAELAAMMPKNKIAYVFFNNIYMTEDALKFKELVEEKKRESK